MHKDIVTTRRTFLQLQRQLVGYRDRDGEIDRMDLDSYLVDLVVVLGSIVIESSLNILGNN